MVLTALQEPGFAGISKVLIPRVAGKRLDKFVRVPGLGVLGIDPATAIDLPVIPAVRNDGIGSVSCPIPSIAALRGAEIWIQGLWVDGKGGAQLSNVARTTIR